MSRAWSTSLSWSACSSSYAPKEDLLSVLIFRLRDVRGPWVSSIPGLAASPKGPLPDPKDLGVPPDMEIAEDSSRSSSSKKSSLRIILRMSSSSSMSLSSSSTTASTFFNIKACLFFRFLTWSSVILSTDLVSASRAGWHASSRSTILSLKLPTTRPRATSKTLSSKGRISSSSSSLSVDPGALAGEPPVRLFLSLSRLIFRMISERRLRTYSSSLIRSESSSAGSPKRGIKTSSLVMIRR
mmetsp:Transcript_4004/g.14351  ORF Transcript_4004/g.14351 Transcript_4004/m.14351 type:complete len:241 (-) Transcript_4004:780-1502(-)